jgi:membrane dipeptidase
MQEFVAVSDQRDQAQALIRDTIAADLILPWSNYGDPALRKETLPRYVQSGYNFVGLSLVSDAEGPEALLHILGRVRREIRENGRMTLISTVADVRRAHKEGKLAVSLNLQGSNSLAGDLNLVQVYYDLGVRHILLVYNHKNMVGDGVHERTDCGLSRYGVELVREMNAVGMMIDCTHTGYRTSMEAIEISESPVIFSHSNPKALWEHDRNIRDDQAQACAARGGWIGVNGVGIFMGEDDASTETFFRHIDYWANLVGPEHVGIGTDYVYDPVDMHRYMAMVKSPHGGNYHRMRNFVQPEQLVELVERMMTAGYTETDIRGILGENYLAVAERIWR